MKRLIHPVFYLVSINIYGKSILITLEDFSKLVEKLMGHLPPLDSAAFKMAAIRNMDIGNAKERLPFWETEFIGLLLKYIENGSFAPEYDFCGSEAKLYVDDFFEAYRFSYLLIDVRNGCTHDGVDEAIAVSLHRRRSLFDKLLRRLGAFYGELIFIKSTIRRISGSSVDFILETESVNVENPGLHYRFGPNGVSRIF